jgi:hypothetical protein
VSTSKDRADEIAWSGDWEEEIRRGGFCDPGEHRIKREVLSSMIAQAIDEATTTERMRCAAQLEERAEEIEGDGNSITASTFARIYRDEARMLRG